MVFTALHCMQRGIGDRNSVRPFVCLSVKHVNCDKTNETPAHLIIPYERSSIMQLKNFGELARVSFVGMTVVVDS